MRVRVDHQDIGYRFFRICLFIYLYIAIVSIRGVCKVLLLYCWLHQAGWNIIVKCLDGVDMIRGRAFIIKPQLFTTDYLSMFRFSYKAGSFYDVAQCSKTLLEWLHELTQNINQMFDPQKISHTLLYRASSGVSLWISFRKFTAL